jgi:murein DD-endopeptidase MepM/ murein hydrolase activator NlpD
MGARALFCLLVAALGAPAETLEWPLDLQREVTSSFGEYRPGRFHAGIDLRTGGIGVPVKAAGDGYVSRVRCSPYGYGKAVYLALDDGHTVVYGHLSDYRDDVRAYVRAAQHEAQDYTVDLSPAPGEFRVKRGEIIAKSGDTGIGVPHLHWEIRDAKGMLVNPRLLGTAWPDKTRPVIQQLLIWPDEGTVDGDPAPQALAVKAAGNGKYTTAPVKVSGGFAFGVETIDPEQGGAKLGIHEATARVDGAEIFTVRNDYLDYESNSSGAVSFCPYMVDKGQFLTLWRFPGNTAPNYKISKGSGYADALTKPVNAEITVVDFLGNTASVTVPLQPAEAAAPLPGMPGAGRGTATAQAWGDFLTLSYRFDQPEGELPQGTLEFNGESRPLAFFRAGQKTYRAVLHPEKAGTYTLRARHPRVAEYEERFSVYTAGGPLQAAGNGGFSLAPAANSAYGALFISISTVDDPPKDPIRRLGQAWRVGPANQPINEALTVTLPVPANASDLKRVAIYRSSGSGWSRLETERAGEVLRAKTQRLGIFAALEDIVPPVVSHVAPKGEGAPAGKRPALSARINDTGSGIKRYSIHCGNTWLLASYDPEHAIIRWEQDEDLPSGTQEITFRAEDAAGNVTAITQRVLVP